MDCARAAGADGAAATGPSRADLWVGRPPRECHAVVRAATRDRAQTPALASGAAPARRVKGEAAADPVAVAAAVAVRASECSSSMDKTCRTGVRGDQPMP